MYPTSTTPAPHARRRTLLTALALAPLATLVPLAVRAEAGPANVIDLWKTRTCGCCGDWVKHVEQNGFTVRVHEVDDTAPIRRRMGIAQELGSCHTGLVGGYALEGHVPASSIQRLLAEKPDAVGLVVPGMPVGSPGMDGPVYQGQVQPYDVLLVRKWGQPVVFDSFS
ncbi:DUF411 domain-containing protein [Corticimicrobacter populi]|uniref:Metal-binding protein n=1 Tax=Corticimicrobacter populi TaxID=2175229 RepID=A0A2V1K649_9BURK|nr:DUF411 domain-containing protein [Corticimicrobacter populi]PWF25149.1 metal-binding protein [Corticimicrobacter populi]